MGSYPSMRWDSASDADHGTGRTTKMIDRLLDRTLRGPQDPIVVLARRDAEMRSLAVQILDRAVARKIEYSITSSDGLLLRIAGVLVHVLSLDRPPNHLRGLGDGARFIDHDALELAGHLWLQREGFR